ncbi:REV3L [Symbiodinium pilosum]|uniref:DNA polymerase n=1 Tax=Symbiodinium pilosum TaxID=2952 RepID=A0A812XB32_SYMPI|nr:REV3L [Symbiodinium pilosum]
MLLTGTVNTLATKVQFGLTSIGLDGRAEVFHKPWFGTFNMLFAMSLVMVVERIGTSLAAACCRPRMKMEDALLPKEGSAEGRRRKILLVAIPAFSDLLATVLACIGIMYIPASVWQMLRGATLFFTGIFSVTLLKHKLYVFNWIGLLLCITGVVTVGYASVEGEKSGSGAQDSSSVAFGVTLTLLGQVVQAAQVIAEEYLMKDVDLPAVEIIGYEGLWGVLMMVVIVYPTLWLLPGPDHGHAEDIVDTLALVNNSHTLLCVVTIYLISCGTFNITGIAVTGALSAVHRMMLDASRTMIIWGFGLFVHYKVDPQSPFGEEWTSSSRLQLCGFLVLITGQAIYGEIIRLPGLRYPAQSFDDHAKFASPAAALNFASKARCSLRLLDALNVLLTELYRVAGQRGAECIPLVMECMTQRLAGRLQDLGTQAKLGVLEAVVTCVLKLQGSVWLTCLNQSQVRDKRLTPLDLQNLLEKAAEERHGRCKLVPKQSNKCRQIAVFMKRTKKAGILPRMLHEILQTRIMVKKALKALHKDVGNATEARARLLDARQFGLKMIANVTYGYTGASFSGRMPFVELADAIVQTARRTLERAVRWVEKEVAGAEVLYGDTDSMFVRLPGRSKEEAFKEGARIAKEVTSHNPTPVELQMDKVYWPCCLVSKKRYVGHAWTSPSDAAPVFDAKGIETVRRDQCAATQHVLRGALEVFFESRGDLSVLKQYIRRHVDRMREGRFNLHDFIFHHEVRPPDEYKGLGPLAAQAVRRSGASWPSPGERFSFVVAEGPPGSRLADVAVIPDEVTGGRPVAEAEAGRAPLYLDIEYYLERQMGPTLHRLFMLVRGPNGLQGQVDVRRWIAEGPRPKRRDVAAMALQSSSSASAMLSSMASGYSCQACGQRAGVGIRGTIGLCNHCQRGAAVPRLLDGMCQRGYWEKRIQGCREMCMRCCNSVDIEEDCRNIYCKVFFRKVNAQLQLSACVAPKSWPAAVDW